MSGFDPTAMRGKWFEVNDFKPLGNGLPNLFVTLSIKTEVQA
jgi:hypothetical protein